MASNREYFSQKFRLWTGFFLTIYTVTHMIAHSFGIFGLDVLEKVQDIARVLWRFPPVNALLYLALITHVLLALTKNLRRKSFRGLTGYEWTQFITAILIPLFLSGHIIVNRYFNLFHGVDMRYTAYFFATPSYLSVAVVIMTVIIFIHAYMGVRNNIIVKPWYAKARPWMLLGFVVIPLLAIMGKILATWQAHAMLDNNPEAIKALFAKVNPQKIDILNDGLNLAVRFNSIFLGLLALLFLGRWILIRMKISRKAIRISYPNGVQSLIFDGASLLDASMMAGIPHAHICGGRGRCSTCRVRIDEGMEHLSPVSAQERRVLNRIQAAPNIRLACQTFPVTDLKMHPVLPSDVKPEEGYAQKAYVHGADQEVVILFADMRGFTRFSENRLPYDVVFILNEYFKLMGVSVESAGGYLDKFIGDGTMAIFGIEDSIRQAAINSLKAAYYMGENLARINREMAHELPEPLKIGIGLHSGQVIVGKMGYRHTSHLTAIGDAVNTASRLEAATKELGVQLLVSEATAKASALDFSALETRVLKIRGRNEEIRVFPVPDTRQLESILGDKLNRIEVVTSA